MSWRLLTMDEATLEESPYLLPLLAEAARGGVCYRIDAETGIGPVMGPRGRGGECRGASQSLAGGVGGRESDVDRTIPHRLTGLPHSWPSCGPRSARLAVLLDLPPCRVWLPGTGCQNLNSTRVPRRSCAAAGTGAVRGRYRDGVFAGLVWSPTRVSRRVNTRSRRCCGSVT
jgi:hypothetical protein